ncbi:MAG: transposase [Promethearchaeota archaeon]|nr:MAG: transposase [Candidatus Lokiarchaeota archaeon]
MDSKALQTEWRHLGWAYKNFFRGLKNGQDIGFPKFKSKRDRQSYTTYSINNNCKIDFERKKVKLPKISWIKYRDNRVFEQDIRHITVSKTRSGKYYASILIEIEENIKPKQGIDEDKIVAFDMSPSKFLITKELGLSSPHFYRNEETKLKKLHREVSRKTKGSNNRKRAREKLATLYEIIRNRKKDWMHKMTHLLSEHFDCVILEDLNIKGMQTFSSGLSKSVSLDFSWNKFLNLLKYRMEEKGKHVVLIDRYFPSSKVCSNCGYKNDSLTLSDREWICPNCNTHHNRDVNASQNIRKEEIKQLKDKNITIITHNDSAVGTTVNAFGEDVRLMVCQQSSMNYESIALYFGRGSSTNFY